MIYRAVSYDIEVMAEPEFLANESDPKQGRWFWAYTITIANHGSKTVRLISRHWRITDALGRRARRAWLLLAAALTPVAIAVTLAITLHYQGEGVWGVAPDIQARYLAMRRWSDQVLGFQP